MGQPWKNTVRRIPGPSTVPKLSMEWINPLSLHSFMEGTGDYFVLLFFCQLMEIYRISGYAYRKLRIVFRMLLGIQQGFFCEDIYVEVVSSFFCIAFQQPYQVIDLCVTYFHKNLHSAAFQLAAQIVMTVFQFPTLLIK